VLAMRQAVLAAAGDEQRLFQQHPHAADGVLRVLRGLLWLAGERHPRPAAEVIEKIERSTARPLVGLRALLSSKAAPGWTDFCALHDELEALGSAADAS
ncbi:MAG TPA: hypothetical protein VHY20_07730, partial [Pirellulales bacterium]|nr:hypothetical protein [Pirellulales bacterium]